MGDFPKPEVSQLVTSWVFIIRHYWGDKQVSDNGVCVVWVEGGEEDYIEAEWDDEEVWVGGEGWVQFSGWFGAVFVVVSGGGEAGGWGVGWEWVVYQGGVIIREEGVASEALRVPFEVDQAAGDDRGWGAGGEDSQVEYGAEVVVGESGEDRGWLEWLC